MTGKVKSVNSNETVLGCLQKISEHNVGSLIVVDGSMIVGIVTERDVIEKIDR